ncbi:MAG: histidine phosphatase family protein [Flavobacteriaceae bacterium]
MKILYMVRHAKSSWEHDVIDHKRPLNKRGERDVALVSKHVSKNLKAPEKIISSDALRASTTAIQFKKAFAISDANFEMSHNLYDFSGHKVIELIKNLDDSYNTIMIVGHNHAFTSVANMLGSIYIDNVPTCGFVEIHFEENKWKTISRGTTMTTIFPRDLKK